MKMLLLPVLFVAGAATAQADQALATKNQCMACHAVDKKLVGPSYRDVAKRYAGNPQAQDLLTRSIKTGGLGKWGAIPMPVQTKLSEEDARKLATWILEIK
jgi:cytochrome c